MKVSDEKPDKIMLLGTNPNEAHETITKIPGRYYGIILKIHITTADDSMERKITTSEFIEKEDKKK